MPFRTGQDYSKNVVISDNGWLSHYGDKARRDVIEMISQMDSGNWNIRIPGQHWQA